MVRRREKKPGAGHRRNCFKEGLTVVERGMSHFIANRENSNELVHLFARRLFLGNATLNNPTLASEILQILQAKGLPLPADGDDQHKVSTFFGIWGMKGEGLLWDGLFQELREIFQRREMNRGTPARLRDEWRQLEERLNAWRERLDRDRPPPHPSARPPGFPPPPAPATR